MTDELIINRVFDAPVEVVWRAWTEPDQAKKWWGPKNFTAPTIQIDFRVGGKYLFCMRGAGPDGKVQDFWSTGAYKEIVPNRKLVMTDSFADAEGNVVPASYYGMSGDFPLELEITITFQEDNGKTTMILRHAGMPAGQEGDLAKQGWNESLDKLAESLK